MYKGEDAAGQPLVSRLNANAAPDKRSHPSDKVVELYTAVTTAGNQ